MPTPEFPTTLTIGTVTGTSLRSRRPQRIGREALCLSGAAASRVGRTPTLGRGRERPGVKRVPVEQRPRQVGPLDEGGDGLGGIAGVEGQPSV